MLGLLNAGQPFAAAGSRKHCSWVVTRHVAFHYIIAWLAVSNSHWCWNSLRTLATASMQNLQVTCRLEIGFELRLFNCFDLDSSYNLDLDSIWTRLDGLGNGQRRTLRFRLWLGLEIGLKTWTLDLHLNSYSDMETNLDSLSYLDLDSESGLDSDTELDLSFDLNGVEGTKVDDWV